MPGDPKSLDRRISTTGVLLISNRELITIPQHAARLGYRLIQGKISELRAVFMRALRFRQQTAATLNLLELSPPPVHNRYECTKESDEIELDNRRPCGKTQSHKGSFGNRRYRVKAQLPPLLICPPCGREAPIAEMTIDKRFSAIVENDGAFSDGSVLHPKAWQIRCADCDPEVGGYYWFSLSQCDTPAKALDCIMQLNKLSWSPAALQSFIDLMECLFGRGATGAE